MMATQKQCSCPGDHFLISGFSMHYGSALIQIQTPSTLIQINLKTHLFRYALAFHPFRPMNTELTENALQSE